MTTLDVREIAELSAQDLKRGYADELALVAGAFPWHWREDFVVNLGHPLWPTASAMLVLARELLIARRDRDRLRITIAGRASAKACTLNEAAHALTEALIRITVLSDTLITLANTMWSRNAFFNSGPADSGNVDRTALAGLCGAVLPDSDTTCTYPAGHARIGFDARREFFDHGNPPATAYWNE